MRIPKTTETPRYYVATSDTEAFSSWGTLALALDSLARLRFFAPQDASMVIGVIETGPSGHVATHASKEPMP